MFTPGFKLFAGFGFAAVIAALVYGIASGDGGGADYLGVVDAESWTGAVSLGWKGGVGDHSGYMIFLIFGLMALFVGISLAAFRDADADSQGELEPSGITPLAQRPTGPNYWPAVGAFGAGLLIVGLVTHALIFVAGIVVLAVVVIEWMISAWADRATGDPRANAELRARIMAPFEVPLLGAATVALLVLAFSRVLLAVSSFSAIWVATGVAAVVFLVAVLAASVTKLNRNVVAGLLVLGAIAVLTAGIISAAVGMRDFEHGEEHGEQHVDEGAVE